MVLTRYKLGDVVKALDNGKVYEAKILKTQLIGSKFMYFIHFQGWAAKFDLWINEEHVSDKDDVDRMKSLDDLINGIPPTKLSGKKAKRKIEEDPDAIVVVGGEDAPKLDDAASKEKARADLQLAQFRKRRKQLSLKDMAENEDPTVSAKVSIPLPLKKHLVDEWGLITSEKHLLLKLPRLVSAEKAIQDYLDEKTKDLRNFEEIAEYKDLFGCLKSYFDLALPSILLYRHERAQYDEVCAATGSAKPSQVYGAEHLLRFFVKMPRLMSSVYVAATDVNAIVSKLVDFMGFLNTNSSTYFDITDYVQSDKAIANLGKWKAALKAPVDGPKTRHLNVRRK